MAVRAGVFWEDVAGSQRNTTANAANAEAGLELYQLTKDSTDLSWATRMYQWVDTCLASSDGLYYDHVNPGGSVNTTIWSYNQGTMIGAGVLLYQITAKASYLTAAEQTATAAVSYFGTGTTLQNQGPAFNAIYFRDLFVLEPRAAQQRVRRRGASLRNVHVDPAELGRIVPPERTDIWSERNRADGRDLCAPRRESCPALANRALDFHHEPREGDGRRQLTGSGTATRERSCGRGHEDRGRPGADVRRGPRQGLLRDAGVAPRHRLRR